MSDTTTTPTRSGARRFGAPGQKIPPFARYEGTSAWRKNRARVREYYRYLDAVKRDAQAAAPAPAEA